MPKRKPRSAGEKALLAKAAKYLPGGSTGNTYFNPEDALIVREARGSKIIDFSGNEYIDYLLGSGPMLIGHSHPEVVEAVSPVTITLPTLKEMPRPRSHPLPPR